MPLKWTIFLLVLFVSATLMFSILEKGSDPARFTAQEGVTERYALDVLTDVELMDIINPVMWVINFVGGQTGEWMEAVLDIVLFNYGMFETGAWVWVKYFFWCVGLAWILGLVVAIGRGVGSS